VVGSHSTGANLLIATTNPTTTDGPQACLSGTHSQPEDLANKSYTRKVAMSQILDGNLESCHNRPALAVHTTFLLQRSPSHEELTTRRLGRIFVVFRGSSRHLWTRMFVCRPSNECLATKTELVRFDFDPTLVADLSFGVIGYVEEKEKEQIATMSTWYFFCSPTSLSRGSSS
jgi:hypothetical protein